MGQSLTRLLVHAIFSTKDRRPFLRSGEIRNEIYAYMAGTLKNLDCHPIKRMDTVPSPSASPTWHRSRPISSTRQSIIRNLATRKRFVKFSNATGSPSTNAMSAMKHQWVGRPFRARRLMALYPGLKHPSRPRTRTRPRRRKPFTSCFCCDAGSPKANIDQTKLQKSSSRTIFKI